MSEGRPLHHEVEGPRIVLASTSPYRRAQLERLGLVFESKPPRVDEERFKDPSLDPEALARLLARIKAESLVGSCGEDAIIIGGDQVLELDGAIYGKAGSRDGSIEQLRKLSGKTHRLLSAMAIAARGVIEEHVVITRLTMRDLGDDEIARYVDLDSPWDCAGSYKIEGRGIALFAHVATADWTAIEGLPLIALSTALRGLGIALP